MKVDFAYADDQHQIWITLDVTENVLVGDVIKEAVERSSLINIDLSCQKVGIFGKLTKLTSSVKEGDRVEVYQPITRIIDDEDDDD